MKSRNRRFMMTAWHRPHPNMTSSLVAQAELGNQFSIAVWAFPAEIGKQTPTLTNHHQQAAPRMQVMFMLLHMFSELIDTPGQNRNLHLRRSCISLVYAGIRNDLRFFFNWQCHVAVSPPVYQISKRFSYPTAL